LRALRALVSLRPLGAGLAVGARRAVADLVQVTLPVLDQPAAGSAGRVGGDRGDRGDSGHPFEALRTLFTLSAGLSLSALRAGLPLRSDFALRAGQSLQPGSTCCPRGTGRASGADMTLRAGSTGGSAQTLDRKSHFPDLALVALHLRSDFAHHTRLLGD